MRIAGWSPRSMIRWQSMHAATVRLGSLLGRRLRVARDGDVVVVVGDPGVERDQVVLGRELGLLEFLLLLLPLPLVARPQEEEVAARTEQDEDAQDDQANGWPAGGRLTGRGAFRAGPRTRCCRRLLDLLHEFLQCRGDIPIRPVLAYHVRGHARGDAVRYNATVIRAEVL